MNANGVMDTKQVDFMEDDVGSIRSRNSLAESVDGVSIAVSGIFGGVHSCLSHV